jgi:hypothetical protein
MSDTKFGYLLCLAQRRKGRKEEFIVELFTRTWYEVKESDVVRFDAFLRFFMRMFL